ncbi:MAG: Rid family hydrolase [Bacteroidota bacterium]
MTPRERYSSGAPWEPIVGYSRAIKVGDRILVAGTTAVDDEGAVVGKNAYEQAIFVFEKCIRAIEALGGTVDHIVQTRIYVVDIGNTAHDVARAHQHCLADTMPVSTMVGVNALVDPQLIVEVEMEAVL